MAWSDAARAAALEARRAHGKAKSSLRRVSAYDASARTVWSASNPADPYGDYKAARKELAATLKRFRTTPGYAYQGMSRAESLKKISTITAASTKVRNAYRKGKYKPKKFYATDGRGVALAGFLRDQRLKSGGRR